MIKDKVMQRKACKIGWMKGWKKDVFTMIFTIIMFKKYPNSE